MNERQAETERPFSEPPTVESAVPVMRLPGRAEDELAPMPKVDFRGDDGTEFDTMMGHRGYTTFRPAKIYPKE